MRHTGSFRCLFLLLLLAAQTGAQQSAPKGEWRFYGGDQGSSKYSPLDQINEQNVRRLQIVWTWDSPDKQIQATHRMLAPFAYEVTPLMVGGVLYVSTSFSQVAAIEAQTGETLWVFDTESYQRGRPTNLGFVHRGVAYWTDGRQARIFIGTGNAFLWAIDAKTGQPVAEFGDGGKVDLAKAIPLADNARNYAVTSPPLVCRDIVMVGSSISDAVTNKEAPRGDLQAFDVRTGKPAWLFHTVPQGDEPETRTWEQESWKYSGGTNCWSLMSADPELGYVYIPTGTPTNDWYGGHRLGDNLFADSLICLEAQTGKRVWHFQTVHHGLWDYDVPAAPVLCDLKVGGRKIKAVAQITKSGFTYVFDRTNGRPVWPIEERAVPQSAVPGERTSPTQPIPTRPAPFERQGSLEENLIDFTPELRAEARQLLEQYDHGALFTPPSERGTINLPGWGGGGNWWGAAFDPQTGLFYVPSISFPIAVKLVKPDSARSNFKYTRGGGGYVAGPRGLPLFKPPYGRITAINLNSGEQSWMVPHGDGLRKKANEVVKTITGKESDVGPLGAAGGTGPLLTRTLLFVGQGSSGNDDDYVLRAFNKATGRIVAEIALPEHPTGTPMTYLAGGKQYLVLATFSGRLMALALP